MRTSNPTLSDAVFGNVRADNSGQAMTIQGTVNKTLALLFLVIISASWVWGQVNQSTLGFPSEAVSSNLAKVQMWIMVGLIGGLIVSLVTIFKKEWSAVTAPLYAVLEGLAIGGISAFFEMRYPGIVIQAVGLTFGTLFSLLMVYKSGIIKVTNKFRMGLLAATGGIAIFYLVTLILSFFKINIPFLYDSSPMGIGFSLFVVVIAALNLVLDFDFIERASEQNLPKYMEWYGAFGLMVTLIWLYLEILRLLAKLRDRR